MLRCCEVPKAASLQRYLRRHFLQEDQESISGTKKIWWQVELSYISFWPSVKWLGRSFNRAWFLGVNNEHRIRRLGNRLSSREKICQGVQHFIVGRGEEEGLQLLLFSPPAIRGIGCWRPYFFLTVFARRWMKRLFRHGWQPAVHSKSQFPGRGRTGWAIV